MRRYLSAVLVLVSAAVHAAPAIEPPDPTSAERVFATVTEVDTCPPAPVVTRSGSTTTVALGTGPCLSPALNITHRLDLGLLPPGVNELVVTDNGGEPVESLSFVVRDANDTVMVEPGLGTIAGGTVVLVRSFVEHCAGQPLSSCPPPVITFDGVPAINVTVIDFQTFTAVTPPHAAGAVEVRVTSGAVTKASYVFRYFDPAAAPLDSLFERILFPVIYKGPGAFGSVWSTQITFRNSNIFHVQAWNGTSFPAGPPLPLIRESAPAGEFLLLPRESARGVHFGVLIYDVSRTAQDGGTEIPVVRESEFSAEPVDLLNIPQDARFRLTLRIYALSSAPAHVRVRVYEQSTGGQIADRFLDLTSTEPCPTAAPCASRTPSSLIIGDVAGTFQLTRPGQLAIRLDPVEAPIWGFVTITNNTTQHVTVISPQ